ncbi:MAG: cytochrome P460 family protein [Alphaproteobacteria bacterium]
MRRMLSIFTLFSAMMLVGSILSPGVVRSAPPFGAPEDVAYAEQLWTALMKARLVGAQAINAMPYKGSVHKTILITLDGTVRLGDYSGAVIVKKMFQGPEVSVKAVANDPATNLKIVAVMYKRKSGYDPVNRDWFYVKYNPDGSPQTNKKGDLMAGRVGKCIGCHESAPGGDFVYSYDR